MRVPIQPSTAKETERTSAKEIQSFFIDHPFESVSWIQDRVLSYRGAATKVTRKVQGLLEVRDLCSSSVPNCLKAAATRGYAAKVLVHRYFRAPVGICVLSPIVPWEKPG